MFLSINKSSKVGVEKFGFKIRDLDEIVMLELTRSRGFLWREKDLFFQINHNGRYYIFCKLFRGLKTRKFSKSNVNGRKMLDVCHPLSLLCS